MGQVFEGELKGEGLRIGVAVARFNDLVTERLLDGAKRAARQCGAGEDALDVVWVPGSFELPIAAKKMVETGRYDAIVCLGAVVRGETAHFDYVAGEAAGGIARVGLEAGVPVVFAVLTTENMEQALDRAGGKAGNKGFEAVMAAVEMVSLLRKLSKG